jgi:hypothetical protein
MSGPARTISLVISGWTYMVSFPYREHDREVLICSGKVRLAADDEDETERGNLYLEINRKTDERQQSRYFIREDGVNVDIFVERTDFYRILQELKDHFQIPECLLTIELEGPVNEGQGHLFTDFQLNLAVDRG